MSWFKAQAAAEKTAEIWINGQIGEDWWTGNGNTAQAFIKEVEALGDLETINLHINSPGGDVADGLAIFNYLRNHTASVVVMVESQAASIASVIAMAGDEIIMGVGSTMMVHNPWTWAAGNANDFRKLASDLDTITEGLIDSYVYKSGRAVDEIKALLDAETYMTAAEAVEHGFADREDVELKAVAVADMGEIKIKAQMSAQLLMKDKENESLRAELKILKAASPKAAEAKEVVRLCAAAGVDAMASKFLDNGSTIEAVKQKLEAAAAIKTVCIAANIDSAKAIEKMDDTSELLGFVIHEALAAAESDQDNHLSPGAGESQAKAPSAKAIYSQLNNQ
jgi:ATP-dependent Clp protease protease subunit